MPGDIKSMNPSSRSLSADDDSAARGSVSRLCDQCTSLVKYIEDAYIYSSRTGKEYDDTVKNHPFMFNRADDCSFCHLIMGQLSLEDLDELLTMDKLEIHCGGLAEMSLDLFGHRKSGQENKFYWQFSAAVIPKGTAQVKHSYQHILEGNTNSSSTWKLARSWLDNCRDNHECIQRESRILPTRLVYIGDRKIKPRLIESVHLSESIKYCTLSHCWGDLKMVTLQRNNYEEFLSQIPFHKVSRTFQDAMFAARQLGFNYIWIDCLCIIQQDVDDWHKEASTMSSVYSFSSVNLAATAGADGSSGLFFTRNPNSISLSEIYLPSQRKGYIIYNPNLWIHEIEESPLASRGWVLQERFLAPRTIHFTRTQIFFECKDSNSYESFVAAGGYTLERHGAAWGHQSLIQKSTIDIQPLWSRLVESYSRMRLTNEEDKLIALSGISRLIHRHTGVAYLAGMWRADLYFELLWSTREPRSGLYSGLSQDLRRPKKYRAPSRSWASIDGTIIPGYLQKTWHSRKTTYRKLISITEASIKPTEGDDQFGQLDSAYLKIQCMQLKQITVVTGIEGQSLCLLGGRRPFEIHYYPDIGPVSADRAAIWFRYLCLPVKERTYRRIM